MYELLMCLQQSSERVTVMEKKLRRRRRRKMKWKHSDGEKRRRTEKPRDGEEIDNSSDPLIPLDALI